LYTRITIVVLALLLTARNDEGPPAVPAPISYWKNRDQARQTGDRIDKRAPHDPLSHREAKKPAISASFSPAGRGFLFSA